MRIAPLADVKAKFSSYLKATEKGPVLVTRNGKPVAVLLAVASDEEAERVVLANSTLFQAILEKARQQVREGKGVPHDEFWAQVEAHAKKRPIRK